jgi:hypothetical protein
MSKRSILVHLALTVILAAGETSIAMAAGQRSFVASTGNDANVCSLASPCRSFDVAIAKTAAGGEVIVLDSAGYGAATISKPVSIIAPPGVYAGVSVFPGGPTGGIGLVVNPGSGNVTLRGLTLNSLGGAIGISYVSGDTLYVDTVVLTNFPTAGLSATVAANGTLYVAGSTFRNNGTGALLNAIAGTLTFSIDYALFEGNIVGVNLRDDTAGTIHGSTISRGTMGLSATPTTAAKSSKLEVRDCTIADNSVIGVVVGSAVAAPVQVGLVSSLISGNAIAVQVTGAANSAYVSDSTITRNGSGLVYVSSGTAASGIDNRLVNNTSNGTFSSSVPKL